jgi:hypothetical protein
VIYSFDHHRRGDEDRWETVGVAAGHGVNAMAEAFAMLAEMSEDELPSGEYRFQPVGLAAPQWRYFHYEAGEITTLPIV